MKTTTTTLVPLAQEVFADAAQDAAARNRNAKAAMDRVAEMVVAFREAEVRTERAEAEFKRQKAAFLKIEREDLPELLRESGFEELTLTDGTTVKIKDEISCSITEANLTDAHTWLREHELGSIIRTIVAVSFGKDELVKADKLYATLLARFGDAASQSEKVHPQTLKAALNELLANGTPFPTELFSVQPYTIAKLSIAKAKKK